MGIARAKVQHYTTQLLINKLLDIYVVDGDNSNILIAKQFLQVLLRTTDRHLAGNITNIGTRVLQITLELSD